MIHPTAQNFLSTQEKALWIFLRPSVALAISAASTAVIWAMCYVLFVRWGVTAVTAGSLAAPSGHGDDGCILELSFCSMPSQYLVSRQTLQWGVYNAQRQIRLTKFVMTATECELMNWTNGFFHLRKAGWSGLDQTLTGQIVPAGLVLSYSFFHSSTEYQKLKETSWDLHLPCLSGIRLNYPPLYTDRLKTSPYLLLKEETTVLHTHDGKVYTDVVAGGGRVNRIQIPGREKSIFLLGHGLG